MSYRILIADDEPHIARILRMALERAGYAVETVLNGLAALESVRLNAPDFLISDIEMPKMNGQQLIEAIADEIPDRDFPIFIMTSRTNLEYRNWVSRYHDVRFFEKPMSARLLTSTLDQFFEHRELP